MARQVARMSTGGKPPRKLVVATTASALDPPMSPEIKQVKLWRRRLQRAFFDRVPLTNAHVETLQMSEEALKQSKIGKVVKKIAKNKDHYPREPEFMFRERAQELYIKWKHI
ncbi:hypothetical protein CF319_g6930 [Tilletia indica]|nr:hypothetical protein CF319_g6930 [Tilletia indica]